MLEVVCVAIAEFVCNSLARGDEPGELAVGFD
jgi:hypothetical protein